jgi:iron complex outermembrane receptor protein
MNRTRILTATCCLAALMVGPRAQAQSAQASAASSDTVETVIVTAEKRSEDIQTVPITIQAFTAKTLNDLGIKSSTDLGQITPNLDIALPSGAGSQPIVTIRGIGLNDYDSNNAGPNGVYIDEVYLSAPASQDFQVFDLKDVEVLKGPQGTLYGRNTSGGAIVFTSQKPTDDFAADFHADYGNYNTFNFQGGVGGPLAPGLDGRIAMVVNEGGDYMKNELTGKDTNGTNNFAGRAMLQWQPTGELTVLLNVHGGYLDNLPTEYRHVGTLVPGSQYPNPFAATPCTVSQTLAGKCVDMFGYGTLPGFWDGEYNRTQNLRVHDWGGYLRADYSPGPVTFTSLTAFTHNDRFHPEDSDAAPTRLLEINYGVRSNTFTQEFRAAQSTPTYNWVVGAYYLYESLYQNQPLFLFQDFDNFFGAGSGNYLAQIDYDDSHQVTKSYAAFGQGDYKLTDKLKLTFGGRFTYEEKAFNYSAADQFQVNGIDNYGPIVPIQDPLTGQNFFTGRLSNSAFNWRAALNYQFTDEMMAYASAATGFKSGGFNGSFLSSSGAEIAKQLTPIQPEHVTAYEIGVKSNLFDDRLVVDAAGFYNDYNDMQVFTLIPSPVQGNPPLNVLDNAPKAHTDGLDLQMIGKPVDNFTATVNLGWLETRIDQYIVNRAAGNGVGLPNYAGNQLPLAPHVSLSTILDYRLPLAAGALDFQFNANFKSHQFFDTSNDPLITQNAYWIENARVAYAFDDGRWEVAGWVHNLSNKEYLSDSFDLSSPFGLIEQVVGMPRTFGVEVNFQY